MRRTAQLWMLVPLAIFAIGLNGCGPPIGVPAGGLTGSGGGSSTVLRGVFVTGKESPVPASIDGTFKPLDIGPDVGTIGGLGGDLEGIFVEPQGAIFIADTINNRIVSYSNGHLNTFGSRGSGQGQFNSPTTLYVGSGGSPIYICDTGNNRIVRMNDMTGAGWITLNRAVAKTFLRPHGICISGNGTGFTGIWIADTGNNRIVKVSDMTDIVGQAHDVLEPRAVFITSNHILLASRNSLYQANDITLANATIYGSAGPGVGHFGDITSVFVSNNGLIYIADPGNNRIVSISNINGDDWREFSPGYTDPAFFPTSVCAR